MAGHFSRYAGGLPGSGLLLLRATVGVMAVTQGYSVAPGHESGSAWLWIFAVVMCLGGAAIILGALTIVTGLTIGFAEVGMLCSLLPFPPPVLGQCQATTVLVTVMTLAVILIGPGAFSVDARLFGLREVKISPVSSLSDR